MYLYLYRWCGILVIPGFLQLSVQQIPFVRNIVVQIGYGWTGNLAEENKCIKREQEGNETMTNCHTLANNLYQAWWERWPHARSRVFRFRASALSAFHGRFRCRCDITIPHLQRFRVWEADNALDTNRRCFSILFTYLCVSNISNKTISYTESF